MFENNEKVDDFFDVAELLISKVFNRPHSLRYFNTNLEKHLSKIKQSNFIIGYIVDHHVFISFAEKLLKEYLFPEDIVMRISLFSICCPFDVLNDIFELITGENNFIKDKLEYKRNIGYKLTHNDYVQAVKFLYYALLTLTKAEFGYIESISREIPKLGHTIGCIANECDDKIFLIFEDQRVIKHESIIENVLKTKIDSEIFDMFIVDKFVEKFLNSFEKELRFNDVGLLRFLLNELI
jgi:hypothetical protein